MSWPRLIYEDVLVYELVHPYSFLSGSRKFFSLVARRLCSQCCDGRSHRSPIARDRNQLRATPAHLRLQAVWPPDARIQAGALLGRRLLLRRFCAAGACDSRHRHQSPASVTVRLSPSWLFDSVRSCVHAITLAGSRRPGFQKATIFNIVRHPRRCTLDHVSNLSRRP